MLELSPGIQQQYQYELMLFNPSDYKDGDGLSEKDVFNAHYVLSDYFLDAGEGIRYGVLNYNMLASAVNRQYVGFMGKNKWDDCFHKIATLTFGLTKDHAFQDGNKRTALLSLLLCLNKSKRVPCVPKVFFEDLIVRIASNGLYQYPDYRKFVRNDDPEVEFIATKLRKWTRYRNERLYTITFGELNVLLKQYGARLGDASGNRIDVIQMKNSSSFFSKRSKEFRVCTIGFPGWKKQVSSQDLRYLLQKTGLNAKNGVDSDVFFNGAIPSYELLKEYHKPLQRLKDE